MISLGYKSQDYVVREPKVSKGAKIRFDDNPNILYNDMARQ